MMSVHTSSQMLVAGVACCHFIGAALFTGTSGVAPESAVQSGYFSVQTPDSAAAWNNLANAYLSRAEMDTACIDTAMAYYHKAIRADPEDSGIKLNLAIAYLMQDDTSKADSLFRLAYEQTGRSLEKVHNLLSLDYDESSEAPEEEKATASYFTEHELRQRITKSAKKKPDNKTKTVKKKTKTVKKQKKNTRRSGRKSVDPREIKKYLYWKL